MRYQNMKTKLLLCAIAAAFSFTASADDHLEKLHKDTQIMQNIMTTSLKQDSRRGGVRFRKIETGYLVGQGLVFDVYTSSSGNMSFNFDFSDMMSGLEQLGETLDGIDFDADSSVVIVPPEAPEAPGFSFSFDFEEEAHEMAEEARERARELERDSRDRWRQLRDKERDINWEKREYERNIRDLEFELRHSNHERGVEIEQELEEVKKRLEKLEAKRERYEKEAEELEGAEKERKAKRQQAKVKQVKQFLADFEATIADTLCDYGSGLKSLPDNEKVNFVLKDFAKGEGSRSRDQLDKVYVFALNDVRECVLEKISPNDLLMKTETYLF